MLKTNVRLNRILQRNAVSRAKHFLLGRTINDGAIFKLLVYIILISIAVLLVRPLVYMISTSFMSSSDLMDPTVTWIPRKLDLTPFIGAMEGLVYWKGLQDTAYVSIAASLLQVVSCGITGYAFARLQFPFKNVLFLIVLLTFLVPQQVLVMPLFVLFAKFKMLDSSLPFIIPAIFAQGLRGSLFIIIFRQFFATLPKELEESAKIDGSGLIRTFVKVMLPLAGPAILIVFLFSFVWHWNDFFEPNLYLRASGLHDFMPLSMRLDKLHTTLLMQSGGTVGGEATANLFDRNESLTMAALVLIVLPPLILYMFAQRYFIQGIERTGIVE